MYTPRGYFWCFLLITVLTCVGFLFMFYLFCPKESLKTQMFSALWLAIILMLQNKFCSHLPVSQDLPPPKRTLEIHDVNTVIL